MLVIALTAATVCTARACAKRLDKTQWPETRDETYWAETETYCSETETLRILSETRPRRDVSTSRDHLETETSRPRPHPWLTFFSVEECHWFGWTLQRGILHATERSIIPSVTLTVSNNSLKQFFSVLTSVTNALEVNSNVMHYIIFCFTYLLTY